MSQLTAAACLLMRLEPSLGVAVVVVDHAARKTSSPPRNPIAILPPRTSNFTCIC